MKLGEIIKIYRDKHDLSMEQFGSMAGISKMTISVLERNYNPKTGKEPSASSATLRGCAKAMSMTLDELIAMLDDDQLVHVATTMPMTEYARTNNLDSRFEQLIDELENRKDGFSINDIQLTEKDIKFICESFECHWNYVRSIIASGHNQNK